MSEPAQPILPVQPAPVARGLTNWPSNPPAFDEVAPAGETLCVPLSVRPNDTPLAARVGRIARGAPLTDSHGLAQHGPLAPADGEVLRPCPALLFDGTRVDGVELQTSATLPSAPRTQSTDQPGPALTDSAALIDRLTELGVHANRIDSPDLLAQLHATLRRPVDTVVCTIMDVDPSSCVQTAWAAAHAEDLVAGVMALAAACHVERRMIVIDERAPGRWLSSLRSAARNASRTLRIVEVENDYPQADPTLLLYTLLNRRLKPRRLPTDQGVLVLDAAAAVAVGAAVSRGEPMLRVPLALRDRERAESYFLVAPIGMSVRQILGRAGIHFDTPPFVRGGDVLRDRRVSLGAVVSGSELVLHVSSVPQAVNPESCIRCAWCFEACPTRIQPANLLEAAQRDDQELASRAGLASCIECGICTYVCPSRLPLLGGIRDLLRNRATATTTMPTTPITRT